jgi:sulfatase maturation enzyme AslB (radical SAM superfamily)
MISTNASARPTIWEPLGKLGVTILFTIDGLEDTHKLYRQYTNWAMIINNAKTFIDAGGQAQWKMIKFDHNKHQIDECRALAAELGFTSFDLIDQSRSSGPVFDREGNLTHILGAETPKEPTVWSELKASKDWFKDHVQSNILTFYHEKPVPTSIACKAEANKEIYITATGEVYPCCWTGFYPGQMFHPGNEQINEIRKENNALEYGIEHSIAWFVEFDRSWKQTNYESGSLHTCNNTCGVMQ